MYFNYYFDLAAISIFIMTILLYYQQNFVKNNSHYSYVALWIVSFITPFADIASVETLRRNIPDLFELSNIVYYLGQQLTAFFFLAYAVSPLLRREVVSLRTKILFLIPIISISILILTNFYTHWLYYFDFENFEYHYGPLQFICYLTSLFYFAYSIYYCVSKKNLYVRHLHFVIYNCLVIIVIFLLLSLFYPNILTKSFSISLCLLQVLVISMKQHATINPETKLLSNKAFSEEITNLIYNKIPFNIISIRIADYEIALSTYGMENVNELKKLIALELDDLFPTEHIFNLHEDIFTIIFEQQKSEDNRIVLLKIDELLQRKHTVKNIDISFSHFVTSLNYPEHFSSLQELTSLLIYYRKTHKMRYGIVEIEELTLRNFKREQDIEAAITDALTEKKFEMFYQPIYDTSDKKFRTSEALIRLNNSIIGFIGPNEFIPIAEKSGQILLIGEYVLDSVFRFISENDIKQYGVDYIEVNLSTIQCLQRNFIVNLFSLAKKYHIDPSQICFEITETASNCSPEIFHQNLQILHDAGYKLAIDDFGTGYGNLTRLISTEFDIVKFDKNTTEIISTDEKMRPLFSKMVKMLHSMGCHVVAEGVETQEQYNFLAGIETDFVQGFLFSKPLPGEDYLGFLKSNID